MLEKLKNFKWGYVILFLMLAVVGVCFAVWHDTLHIVAIVMGVILAIYGIVLTVLAVADRNRKVKFAIRLTIGIIAIVCGVITAIFREGAIELIASLFALFLIVDGSFKLHTAALSKRYKLFSWWLMLVPAILVIIGGFVTLRISPESLTEGTSTVSVLLGITMVVDAISNLLSAFYITGYEKGMVKEIKEELIAKDAETAASEKEVATPVTVSIDEVSALSDPADTADKAADTEVAITPETEEKPAEPKGE